MDLLNILIVCVLVLSALCFILAYKLVKFSLLIIEVEDAIDECVALLDERYKSVSEILEIPVFFDSIEVRRVISDMRDCQNAIVVVANRLTNDIGLKGEITEES